MGTPIGILSKLYYRSGGTYNSPTWAEVAIAGDVSVSPQWDEADISSRGSRVKSMKKSMLGLEMSVKLKKVPGNSVYGAFVDALMSDGVLDVLVLDGDKATNDVRGWRYDAQVFQGNDDQSLNGGGFLDLVLKPMDDTNPTKAVLVTAGALTFATPGASGGTYA
jgi:hypothetical protein